MSPNVDKDNFSGKTLPLRLKTVVVTCSELLILPLPNLKTGLGENPHRPKH